MSSYFPQTPKPSAQGFLVLVNDVDWELLDTIDCKVLFPSCCGVVEMFGLIFTPKN